MSNFQKINFKDFCLWDPGRAEGRVLRKFKCRGSVIGLDHSLPVEIVTGDTELKWTGRKLSVGVSKPNARDANIVVAQVRREL